MIADLCWALRRARPAAGRFALAALAGAGASAAAVGLLAVSAWLISTAALHPPVFTLTVAIVTIRACALARGGLRYLERLVSHDAALRMLAGLRVGVYRTLERITPGGLGSPRTGDVLSRVVSDVDAVQELLLRVLVPAAAAALVTAGTLILLAVLVPAAALVVGAAAVFSVLGVPTLTTRLAAAAERGTAPARGELSADIVDLLHGAGEVVAFGATARRMSALRRRDALLTGLLRRAAAGAGTGTGLALLGGAVAVLGSLLTGIAALRTGALSGPQLAVVALTPLALWEALLALPPAVQRLPGLAAAAGRLHALETTPAPVAEPAVAAEVPPGAPPWVARELALRWPGAERDAVAGLDLVLAPLHCVALAGPSGAGKSTVAAALLRFLDPSGGVLRLGTVDVRRLPTDTVRARVAWCGPDTHLFDTSIRENLLVGRPDADASELLDALGTARLRDWVLACPDGLDTMIGEGGARLSGGERQRLGLARALLARRPLLILDEPTAHLDRPTAAALTRDLAAAARHRTTLLISHDRELTARADQVLRLGPADRA